MGMHTYLYTCEFIHENIHAYPALHTNTRAGYLAVVEVQPVNPSFAEAEDGGEGVQMVV